MFVNPKPHPHRHARRVVALLSLIALGATACSDDENDAVTTTAAPATTADGGTATTAGPTTTVAPPMGDIVATALTNQVFTQLAGMVVDAGLVQTLRGADPGFTVFAPTDQAFDKLPVAMLNAVQDLDGDGDGVKGDVAATVLLHHVIPGKIAPADMKAGEYETAAGTTLTVTEVDGELYVDGNKIGAGVEATNGWVYVMGDVLVPALGDIVDIASTFTCCFSTLVDLVGQADLVDTLKGDGPFTVFAPMDSAFAEVPEATLNSLVGQYTLAGVLTFHVVAGKITTDQLTDGQVLETVAGLPLTVDIAEDGTITLNGAPIAVGNVQATNGVIHVMSAVMVPAE